MWCKTNIYMFILECALKEIASQNELICILETKFPELYTWKYIIVAFYRKGRKVYDTRSYKSPTTDKAVNQEKELFKLTRYDS